MEMKEISKRIVELQVKELAYEFDENAEVFTYDDFQELLKLRKIFYEM